MRRREKEMKVRTMVSLEANEIHFLLLTIFVSQHVKQIFSVFAIQGDWMVVSIRKESPCSQCRSDSPLLVVVVVFVLRVNTFHKSCFKSLKARLGSAGSSFCFHNRPVFHAPY
jgi:hypothetical protein